MLRPFLAGVASLLVLGINGTAPAQVPTSWQTLERQFREMPMEARRHTGPLFWLHGDESAATLASYVEQIAKGGNGCFTAESRPHNDWLGDGWYRDLAICLQAAKDHDLQMWIFDEEWWPSQMLGGRVPAQYGTKRLVVDQQSVGGLNRLELELADPDHFVALLAGQANADGLIDDATIVDLEPQLQNHRLTWEVPAGNWQVLTFRWQPTGPQGHQKKWISVDGASRDCVDWFVQTVYQPHYDRFSEDFGKSIVGFFYDEPETQGDWGTEVLPELKHRGIDWKKALVAKMQLIQDPEQQTAGAYQYQDAFAEAWGRTMYGGMTEWCRRHGVRSIGHFMEHDRLYLHPTFCAGNMFQLQKYSDMGAIDLVVHQMYPGDRPESIYQTPKLASSISHVYGKQDDLAMCEIYGGYDQKITYPQMKWLADQHQVRGVNFMIPHSFNPRAPYDHDYPPYFYNNGYEPRWPLFRVWADYSNRLSTLLTGGRHVCPVALLYLGNSYHAGASVLPEHMTSALQDALFDCDWVPYDAFVDDTQIDNKTLRLHQERYRVLVLPAAEVVPVDVLEKATAFYESGGVVVAYGMLPSRSATLGKTSSAIRHSIEAIFGQPDGPGMSVCQTNPAGGRSYYLPEKPTPEQLQQVLAQESHVHPTLEVISGDTDDWLHVLHRIKSDRDIFFVTNQQHDGPIKTFQLRITADGDPELWDAMRGTVSAVPFRRTGEHLVELDLTLHPLESALLVFSPGTRDLPPRIAAGAEPVHEPLRVERLPTPEDLRIPNGPSDPPAGQTPTTSPVVSDPFVGEFSIPESWQAPGLRIVIECDQIVPEAAAAVTVNDSRAGGFIGAPLTLDITGHVRAGKNRVVIEPFAPASVRVAVYQP